MRHQNYYVYILANIDRHTILYIGGTSSVEPRASEHGLGLGSAFARQYNARKLIYFEADRDPRSAIPRENGVAQKRKRLLPEEIRNGTICLYRCTPCGQ